MPAMSTLQPLETIDFPGADTVVVRFRGQTLDRMHEAMDHAFGLLGEAIQAGRFRPAGPAFARYEGDVRQGLCDGVDLEVGFPVDTPLKAGTADGEPAGEGERAVVGSSLPACRLAITRHHGSYEQLPQAWGEFVAEIEARGLVPADLFWEAYDTEPGPDVDPADLITGLAVPLRD